MNLVELILKKDRNLVVERWEEASSSWQPWEDPRSLLGKKRMRLSFDFSRVIPRIGLISVRGVYLHPGMRLVVKNGGHLWPRFTSGQGIFKICTSHSQLRTVIAVVGWSADAGRNFVSQTPLTAHARLRDFTVPATTDVAPDLVIQVFAQTKAGLFVGVHQLLDRRKLYSHCKGVGVELGPGPQPQILPSGRTKVTYVEPTTPGSWQTLYGSNRNFRVDSNRWRNYVIGTADAIPATPASLDFVFSSHVFEHLANPLGYLAYWATLLKVGGVVAAIIPDHSCCKDYVFAPSTLDELKNEFNSGLMSPSLAHYQRWAQHRAPATTAAELRDSGRSIHVHFYTPESIAKILGGIHVQLGFSEFSITHAANHKDFFILLRK